MIPLFFEEGDKQLFAVYHEANTDIIRNTSVLICNPIGFEYEKSHNVIRQLASKLADLGYHVLRFDYFATGDSAGYSEKMTIEQCITDVQLASKELIHLSANKKLSIIGFRFGALIATYASQNIKVRNLVLLDPVLDGNKYLGQLKNMHKIMLSRHPSRFFENRSFKDHFFRNNNTLNTANELLGYRLSQSWEKEISAYHIDKIKKSNIKSKRINISIVVPENNQQSIDNPALFIDADKYVIDSYNDWYNTENIGIKIPFDTIFTKTLAIMK